MAEIGRPVPRKRVLAILEVDEINKILLLINGVTGLGARLIYGTGMCLREGLSLRIKDVGFEPQAVIVWEKKEGKDDVVMLPVSLEVILQEQIVWHSLKPSATSSAIR